MSRKLEREVLRFADHLQVDHGLARYEASVGAALFEQSAVVGAEMVEAAADARGPMVHEPTLTYLALKAMRNRLPAMTVLDVGGTKRETEQGLDWEWWVEGRQQWFHFYVQAKRLRRRSGPTSALVYDLGQTAGGARQVDTLVSAARAHGIPAIYALYNPASTWGSDYATSHCASYCRHQHPPAEAGITTIGAETAQMLVAAQARRGKSVEDVPLEEVRPVAFAWPCLVGCRVPRRGWPRVLPPVGRTLWQALGFVGAFQPADLAFQFARATTALSVPFWEGSSSWDGVSERFRGAVVTQPPSYVAEPGNSDVVEDYEAREGDLTPAKIVVLRNPEATRS